jgi:sec-independent protein translocase protein TatA
MGGIGDLFDSPWKILIIAVVIIVLFGSKKLPHAARSLGQSMRILKKEVQGLHEDEPAADTSSTSSTSNASPAFPPPAAIAATQPPDQQQAQIDALQQQIRDLQRAAATDAAPKAPAAAGAEASRPVRQPV